MSAVQVADQVGSTHLPELRAHAGDQWEVTVLVVQHLLRSPRLRLLPGGSR